MAKMLIPLILLLVAFPAQAMECGDRTKVLAMLDRSHKEAVTGRGLAGGGAMIELFTSRSGATWTLLATPPESPEVSCIITGGETWQPIKFQPVGEKL